MAGAGHEVSEQARPQFAALGTFVAGKERRASTVAHQLGGFGVGGQVE